MTTHIATKQDIERLETQIERLESMVRLAMPEYISTTEAAQRLGCTTSTLYRRERTRGTCIIKSGRIPVASLERLR